MSELSRLEVEQVLPEQPEGHGSNAGDGKVERKPAQPHGCRVRTQLEHDGICILQGQNRPGAWSMEPERGLDWIGHDWERGSVHGENANAFIDIDGGFPFTAYRNRLSGDPGNGPWHASLGSH